MYNTQIQSGLVPAASFMINKALNLLQRVARKYTRVAVDATRHPAESYYAGIYLDTMLDRLSGMDRKPLKVLDVGCGAGRLMTPIVGLGHHVTGIDYHRDSLRLARENLEKVEGDGGFGLIEADVAEALSGFADESFDAAMAIESIFVSEEYEAIVDHMARVLRPGGLLFITHRTRFYYLTKALSQGQYDDAELIAKNTSGRLRKGVHRVFHHWQTRGDIEKTYASRGLELQTLHGIGVCSGFGHDPMAVICDPGEMDEAQQKMLRGVETCDDDLLMTSRFVLAVARKPG